MYSMRCNHCGKFSKIVDYYAPFGSCTDIDPPDDVLLCQKCVDKELLYYRTNNRMPRHWIRAKYEAVLAEELGYIWEIEAGCAWGRWKKA